LSLPSATIIIPCFNHGRFVREAAESALRQQDADVRVVIVEDGSNDGQTPAACDACAGERITVIHQENRGLPAARNRGAAGAASDYLVFLDADDWIEPTFVSRLAAAMDGAGADVSHAYCQERLVEQGVGIWRVPEWDPGADDDHQHPPGDDADPTRGVRGRRGVGGFDESMTGGYEDWDLWLRFVERGWRGVRVREPLFTWRRHSDSTMVMNVVKNHAALYEHLRSCHRALYDRYARELIVRSNSMLRQYDMNWLDELGQPINLRALKGQKQMYESMLAVRLDRTLKRWFGRNGTAAPGMSPALRVNPADRPATAQLPRE
jgi:glycosyltransferase involved in cell wall biosynthesis